MTVFSKKEEGLSQKTVEMIPKIITKLSILRMSNL